MALFPLINQTTSEIEYFGGTDKTRWIWSFWMFPSKISIFFYSHNCRIISLKLIPSAPLNTLNRYFGHHTTWYLHCHTACDNFLNRLIEYLLKTFRAIITLVFMEVFFLCKSLTYMHCVAWTISKTDGLMD